MGKIKIITSGLLTTIQDGGRFKYQQSGVCVAGVMDPFAHKIANILVGNEDLNEAVIELTILGPTLQFDSAAVIAITGANISPSVNGIPVNLWEAINISPGDTLSSGALKEGIRAYIGIKNGFDIPVVMNSKSTYMRAHIGGFEGRALKAGDIINYKGSVENTAKLNKIPEKYIPKYKKEIDVRVVLGPQDDYFTDAGIATFLSSPYIVSKDFDRMGYRLDGANIEHKDGGDIISDGMVMGAIQVPGGGQPIILMADRQTTGGYTKIAGIISADLYKIGQAKGGDIIRFHKIGIEEAQNVFIKNERLFDEIKENMEVVSQPMIASESIHKSGSNKEKTYALTINGISYYVNIIEI